MGQPLVHPQRLGSLVEVFGQDSIWSNLALNAKIAEIVFSQWDQGKYLRKNPSAAIEIWTLGSRIQHPKLGVKI